MDENKCPTAPTNDTKYCLKNKSLEYTTIDNGLAYSLKLTKLDITYEVTSDSVPKIAESILPESDWITIGTQRWARKNLNVGTRINGSQAQTNNGGTNVVEKYCYGNSDANCTTNNNGGLYQWDEAMGYGMIEGAQGICPTGSHIPSDNDWKILEVQLGMSQDTANIIGWRGTNEGAKLKAGGSSGLNVPLAGLRNTDGLFYGQLSDANLWSSSYFWSTSVWFRSLLTSQTDVLHNTTNRYTGLSIRCLGN
ncbi:hypothetical protein CVV43_04870 [Candidatus Saccharibacteria bacterium HGW-Saccharibacteria-1]|nr:MAG: hypothetical protein CVV43_04870 [Candidatus Saccharibacteria bacterium HGW-Saccharibacteria-1]